MRRQIRVFETTETITVVASDSDGVYKIVWHRTDGMPDEEFHVTADAEEQVDEAVAEDLKRRLGP
jgi:hypothetical protein